MTICFYSTANLQWSKTFLRASRLGQIFLTIILVFGFQFSSFSSDSLYRFYSGKIELFHFFCIFNFYYIMLSWKQYKVTFFVLKFICAHSLAFKVIAFNCFILSLQLRDNYRVKYGAVVLISLKFTVACNSLTISFEDKISDLLEEAENSRRISDRQMLFSHEIIYVKNFNNSVNYADHWPSRRYNV